jgi:hypothetical protein
MNAPIVRKSIRLGIPADEHGKLGGLQPRFKCLRQGTTPIPAVAASCTGKATDHPYRRRKSGGRISVLADKR